MLLSLLDIEPGALRSIIGPYSTQQQDKNRIFSASVNLLKFC